MTTTVVNPDTEAYAALPVIEPADAGELARVLADARSAGRAVLPRGGGTKMDWGNPPRAADVILSTRKLNRVLEHAAGDLTATVEAGCTIAALQQALAGRGQRLAIDPLWPERATIGGVLATNDNGSLRGAYGSLRDLIIGVTVALADGTLARSGGKVVKNVAGYDLPKLMVGSFGTLGVVTQATFRLHPLPQETRMVSFNVPNESLGAFLSAMTECVTLTAGVQVRAADGRPITADVRVEGPAGAASGKIGRVVTAAHKAGAKVVHSDPDPWDSGQRMFEEAPSGVIARASVAPVKLGTMVQALVGEKGRGGAIVAQSVGSGLLRLDAPDAESLAARATRWRVMVGESFGGSLVVVRNPPELRSRLDGWGDVGDALPLMRRVKEQFDPTGVLNPGRFVGGI